MSNPGRQTFPSSENTARQFARNFPTYADAAQVQRRAAEALVELLAETSGRTHFSAATELGCGTGLLTRGLIKRFAIGKLALFDIVANCPDYLRDIAYDSFAVADLDELQSLPATELVVSASCLQWIRNPLRLFRTICASLHSGGLFAASTFSEGNLNELGLCGGTPLPCPSVETWRQLLEESGFVIRRLEAETSILHFPSALEALRHLKRTGVLIPTMRDYRQTRRFLARYETLRRDGTIPLTYTPVRWIAEKQGGI
ncbi:MAG: methyltransferase domain-containing protein [Kiritimatiellia bacterium]